MKFAIICYHLIVRDHRYPYIRGTGAVLEFLIKDLDPFVLEDSLVVHKLIQSYDPLHFILLEPLNESLGR